MEVQQDFRNLLALFNEHKIEYVLVGVYALGFHGVPRYTGGLDIFVRPSPANAQNIVRALNEFGFGSVGLTAEDFQAEDKVIQLGFQPYHDINHRGFMGTGACRQDRRPVRRPDGSLYRAKRLHREQKSFGPKEDLADLEAVGEE